MSSPHITLEVDETYYTIKVKKTDRRVHHIHLSPPATPVMTRRRILQNQVLELDARKDRYIFKYRKKRYALRQDIESVSGITDKDMTEEEKRLMKENWNLREVKWQSPKVSSPKETS